MAKDQIDAATIRHGACIGLADAPMRLASIWMAFTLGSACAASPFGRDHASANRRGSSESDVREVRAQVFIDEGEQRGPVRAVSTPCSSDREWFRFVPINGIELRGGMATASASGEVLQVCMEDPYCWIEVFSAHRLIVAVRPGELKPTQWKFLRDAWNGASMPSTAELLENGMSWVVDNGTLVAASALAIASIFGRSEIGELERQAAMTLLELWLAEKAADGRVGKELGGLAEWAQWLQAMTSEPPPLQLPMLDPALKKILLAAIADRPIAREISPLFSWGGLTDAGPGIALSAVMTAGPKRFVAGHPSLARSDVLLFHLDAFGSPRWISGKGIVPVAGDAVSAGDHVGHSTGPSVFYLPQSSTSGVFVHSTLEAPQEGDEAIPIFFASDEPPPRSIASSCEDGDDQPGITLPVLEEWKWDRGEWADEFLRAAPSVRGVRPDSERLGRMVERFRPSRGDQRVRAEDQAYITRELELETENPAPVVHAPLILWRNPGSTEVRLWPSKIIVPANTHLWLSAVNRSEWKSSKSADISSTIVFIGPSRAARDEFAPVTQRDPSHVALPVDRRRGLRSVWLHAKHFPEPSEDQPHFQRELEITAGGSPAAVLTIRVLSSADYTTDPTPIPRFAQPLRELLDWPDI